MKPKPSAMERRRFMKLLAASGAAVLAGAAPRVHAKSAPLAKRPRGVRAPPVALEKEIRAQKKSLEDALRVIRDFQLSPGTPPAVVFQAMRARKGR